MQLETAKLLEDIRDVPLLLAEVTSATTQAAYQQNRMLRQSVERNFEIIGEAVRRLTQHDLATAQQISGYTHIIAFRNLLIHGYDQLDHRVVWDVIQRDVPLLLAEVTTLLAQSSDDASDTSAE